MSFISKFDEWFTPKTKEIWFVEFGGCIAIIISMYFFGYDDVEIGTGKFYIGMFIVFLFGILGVGLGRGIKVLYQK